MHTRHVVFRCLVGFMLASGAYAATPVASSRLVRAVQSRPAAASQPAGERRQKAHAFRQVVQKEVACPYLLYLPRDYAKDDRRWPLVLFLHGAGNRGDDLEGVKMHGPPKLIEQGREFPFILLSPQCPKDSWWDSDVLYALLKNIVARHRVDERRIYCTGLSMGGYATWDLAILHPELFAAIAPICGGAGQAPAVCKIKNVPVWTFHGDKDTTVPISDTEYLVRRLKECGGNVKFTVYPGVGHHAWEPAYDDPALYEWMLAQCRP